MVLPSVTKLYRYNWGVHLPSTWSVGFHSPEYHSDEFGEKNQIGAFFFYPDEITAHNVLKVALNKAKERGEPYKQNTITSCSTTGDIHLLDLTCCNRPVQMLNILHDEGIDVLTSEFVRHLNGETAPFSIIRDYHKFIVNNEHRNKLFICEMMNYADMIDDFFLWRVGYTGQLMTDFGNGVPFKRELVSKGYEGYQFMEEKSIPTICLFCSEKLTALNHTVV